MDTFFHQLLSGLASGGIYAAIGLSLVMVHQATHKINFAQGEMAMFATYLAWSLVQAGVPYWIAFAITVAASFAGGVLVEKVVLRPVANQPVLAVVIIFVGLLVLFNSLAGWIFTYSTRTFPSPFPQSRPFGTDLVSFHELGLMAVTLAMMAALYLFFRFTTVGLAMRAAAENPVSARLVGIPVGLLLALGWGLACAIGAVAGMMAAPLVFLDPNMMSGILLYGFAAALIGGLSNPWGAVLGGLIVGVLENLAGAYVIGTDLKLTFALAVIVGVLLFKPAGLFGKPIVTRV